jgi:tetratricopeptide (TPR) repeat protein
MPWLEGHDLQERLRGGPLSIEETVALARRVSDALAYLHGKSFVHRDLKPSNLFLRDGKIEEVRVIDLGIARATVPERPLTISGTLVGTPGFLAPELALGDRAISPSVDVFALGCVLFECLTGQRLFGGSQIMAVLAKILVEDAPRVRELRPDVPEALDRLIQRMVAKEPKLRPRDGAQLAKWLGNLPVRRRSSRRQPLPSITTTERRVVSVLVVVLPSPAERPTRTGGSAMSGINALRASSRRFGVRINALDARTAIVLASDSLAAADQASVLARFGRHVAEVVPQASLALATGGAVTGPRLPVGDAIDRGVTLVREAKAGGGVHVDDVSAALLTSRFDVRREGGSVLLADERLSLDPTRPLLGRPTSCVGRDREFAILNATFAACAEGAGPKVVLVTAAAGAGKSRVRHEFLRRLRASSAAPVQVLQCRGDPLHVSTPYALIAQAVRQGAGLRDREPPEVARRALTLHLSGLLPDKTVSEIKGFLGELVGVPFDDAESLALRAARHSAEAMSDHIRHAFETTLHAWCQRQSVVLALEDLHWGDTASIKLLDAALRKLGGDHLLILAFARPEVHERFPTLWSKRDVTEVRLPPLSRRARVQLVREVIGEEISEEDVHAIVERSEGNAFYLEELIRDAAQRQGRVRSRWSALRQDLPETVIAMAQARLERLEPAARKILRAASIYGEVFSAEDLSALLGEEPPALAATLDALVEHEVVAHSEEPRVGTVPELRFRHMFLQSAAYATLTEEDRALGHRLAAQALVDKEEDHETVALHWLEAGERGRAALCFARAAEARQIRVQPEAAVRCAVRSLLVGDCRQEGADVLVARIRLLADALEAARNVDGRHVVAGIERHVTIDGELGGRSIGHIVLKRALEALQAFENKRVVSTTYARAASALGALYDFNGAKELLAQATRLAADDPEAMQEVQWASAKIAYWAGESGAAVQSLSSTVLPADVDDRIEMLLILAAGVVAVEGPRELALGLDYLSRADALVGASGNATLLRIRCARTRFICFHLAGERAKAVEAAEEAVKLSRHAGFRFEECSHLYNLGEQYFLLGDGARARAALKKSHEIAVDMGADDVRLYPEALLAYLDANSARLEVIADDLRLANNPLHEMHARYWLGHLLAAKGAPQARRELTRALDFARDLKNRLFADQCAQALEGLPASM